MYVILLNPKFNFQVIQLHIFFRQINMQQLGETLENV